MKIMICGSMSFSEKMLQVKKKLEKLGHQAFLPPDVEIHLNDPGFIDKFDINLKHCLENDILRKGFDLIAQNEAILVLNYPKNGIRGYVGTSSLMEIGLAHYLNKKIFLLYPTPKSLKARWAHEVEIVRPVILNGNLSKIK